MAKRHNGQITARVERDAPERARPNRPGLRTYLIAGRQGERCGMHGIRGPTRRVRGARQASHSAEESTPRHLLPKRGPARRARARAGGGGWDMSGWRVRAWLGACLRDADHVNVMMGTPVWPVGDGDVRIVRCYRAGDAKGRRRPRLDAGTAVPPRHRRRSSAGRD